jgi:hypothetical protein
MLREVKTVDSNSTGARSFGVQDQRETDGKKETLGRKEMNGRKEMEGNKTDEKEIKKHDVISVSNRRNPTRKNNSPHRKKKTSIRKENGHSPSITTLAPHKLDKSNQ